jgi:hypothetical protein
MKKDVKNVENVNTVANVDELNDKLPFKEMTEEEMQKFVDDNISFVPKVRKNVFAKLELKEKVSKIKLWQDIAKMKAEAIEKNKIENKVKELLDRRKATVEDVIKVIDFCKDYIKESKEKEIAKIDEEIARLNNIRTTLAQE